MTSKLSSTPGATDAANTTKPSPAPTSPKGISAPNWGGVRTYSKDGIPSERQQPAKPTGEQFFGTAVTADKLAAAKWAGDITDEDIKRLADRSRGL